jgi:hypothetical protein
VPYLASGGHARAHEYLRPISNAITAGISTAGPGWAPEVPQVAKMQAGWLAHLAANSARTAVVNDTRKGAMAKVCAGRPSGASPSPRPTESLRDARLRSNERIMIPSTLRQLCAVWTVDHGSELAEQWITPQFKEKVDSPNFARRSHGPPKPLAARRDPHSSPHLGMSPTKVAWVESKARQCGRDSGQGTT